MYFWNWPQFFKNWKSRKCVLKLYLLVAQEKFEGHPWVETQVNSTNGHINVTFSSSSNSSSLQSLSTLHELNIDIDESLLLNLLFGGLILVGNSESSSAIGFASENKSFSWKLKY